jgi:diacylglycerol O-acyltransferase
MSPFVATFAPGQKDRRSVPEQHAEVVRPEPVVKERMTRRDFAWYRMDAKKNLMVINSILLFEGAVDMRRLIATIAHRLPNYPRFTQKIVSKLGIPFWVEDDAFNIANHIELEAATEETTKEALQARLTEMAHIPLDTNRPMWHMSVIDKVNGGYAIVFRVHHCVTDGLGLVHVLNHLTDDNDTHGRIPSRVGHPLIAEAVRPRMCSFIGDCATWLKIAFHVTRLSVLLPDARTQLKAPMTGEKQLVWLPPLALEQVRAMSKRVGVTMNDVWVAASAGALRQYLSERGEQVDRKPLRAAVTFNLREKANAYQLGNQFGLVAVELPTDLADPNQRLSEASRRMNAIKRSQQPRATMAFLSIAGCLPLFLQRFALNLFTSKGSVVLTNIEGPRSVRYLAGSKMTDLMCWVPQAGTIGVGLAFISYAGQIQLALFVDTNLVDDPDRLMALTIEAFTELDSATNIVVDETHPLSDFSEFAVRRAA